MVSVDVRIVNPIVIHVVGGIKSMNIKDGARGEIPCRGLDIQLLQGIENLSFGLKTLDRVIFEQFVDPLLNVFVTRITLVWRCFGYTTYEDYWGAVLCILEEPFNRLRGDIRGIIHYKRGEAWAIFCQQVVGDYGIFL